MADTEKPARQKVKIKKASAKSSKTKKRKSETKDGPTCSMFLAELARKLALKRREEEESPKNIVLGFAESIIESLTNALPIKFTKRVPTKQPSPIIMETLQNYAPELLPNDTLKITHASPILPEELQREEEIIVIDEPSKTEVNDKLDAFKMPHMPILDSEVFKVPPEKKRKITTGDMAVNTSFDLDVAGEIAKHVGTLKRISLIAEEFNKKTAQNLKEIVDSVQEDLIKKLEEAKAEEKKRQIELGEKTPEIQQVS